MASEEKFCIVCGAGSHRADWEKKDAPACDSHSAAEVASAVAKAKAEAAPPAGPVVVKK